MRQTFVSVAQCLFLALSLPPRRSNDKSSADRFLSASPYIDPAFLDGLRNLGYVDGKTIVIELRSAEGKLVGFPNSQKT